ncbi:otoconin-90-like isoform X2 [Amphibalanus amphitrite]|uniref:otoconin-90-like isoform X2 n=1 Tax=Amphibalanus amphitrite TaxID=1232801 RepID=UPI001C9286CD|nr:otoconin-90-like isoform X2 [Amphibalanus amphitrite]
MDGTRGDRVTAVLAAAVAALCLSASGVAGSLNIPSTAVTTFRTPPGAHSAQLLPASVDSLLADPVPAAAPNASSPYFPPDSPSAPSGRSQDGATPVDSLTPAEYEALLRSVSDLDPGSGRALSAISSGATASELRWMLVTHSRRKRNVVQLGDMMKCATGCSPIAYKGYGCYCGFLGSGKIIDGIDHCCYEHDWCYWRARSCFTDPFGVSFYVSRYKWSCQDGKPQCAVGTGSACARELCECDRQFAKCLRHFPCPQSRPVCTSSPLRHWQNLFLGMRKPDSKEHYPIRIRPAYKLRQ